MLFIDAAKAVALPILTARLALRPFVFEDAAELHATVYGDPEVMRWVGGPLDLAGTQAALERWIGEHERTGRAFWGVLERETGLVAGEAGLAPFDDRGPEVELGYTFGRAFWGRGYATEAGAACLDEAFGAQGLAEVVAVTRPENVGSQRVLEKLGFARAGRRWAWGADQLAYVRRA